MVERWKLDDLLMTYIDRYSLFTRSNAANYFETLGLFLIIYRALYIFLSRVAKILFIQLVLLLEINTSSFNLIDLYAVL